MKCNILHESKGRLRVHMAQYRMTMSQADILSYYLMQVNGIEKVQVNERTGNVVIWFHCNREQVIQSLASFHYEDMPTDLPINSSRSMQREYEEKIVMHVLRRGVTRLFLPLPIRTAITAVKSVKYVAEGVKSLLSGKLEVSVLDATSLSVSMLQGDFDTAGDLMFLLGLSEILEEWTHKKTISDLANSMSLHVDKVWKVLEDGQDILVSTQEIEKGDCIRIRTSSVIPLDGIVVAGNADVNQSSLTGESLPVRKESGAMVYAGTVVDEGEIVVSVTSASGQGRYDHIVQMIETNESMKSDSENKAAQLADHLVPYTLGLTAGVYAISRNVTKAMAVLMVDFSCALKLTIPIAMLSAMRQASNHDISVKGGKFLELAANAEEIVFDKTGTLTASTPTVVQVIPFNQQDEMEMLRLAACLEEHYPHSIANAVVQKALELNLNHEEKHTKVEYVVAHGIVSSIDQKKVLIGSYHFVFEDEKCSIPEGEEEKFASLPDYYSHLYLAVDQVLAAVICIEDPIRKEAKSVIASLRESGIQNLVMMTGDSERTARQVAQNVGVDHYFAEVLPADKASYVKQQTTKNRVVMMVGDGINDTPALSAADVAIAISSGAEIAREIADITIPAEDIAKLVYLRQLAVASQQRIRQNYKFIMGFNGSLILLGILGILQPSLTAYLHNASTLALSLYSMKDLQVKEASV